MLRNCTCCLELRHRASRNKRSPLFPREVPAERRLKSRNCFLHSVKSANFPPKVIRCSEWLRRTNKTPHRTSVNFDHSLTRGHDSPWTTWRCLNRLRTCYTCSKEQQKKWKYLDGHTTWECGFATENTAHMLQCTLLARPGKVQILFWDTLKKMDLVH